MVHMHSIIIYIQDSGETETDCCNALLILKRTARKHLGLGIFGEFDQLPKLRK